MKEEKEMDVWDDKNKLDLELTYGEVQDRLISKKYFNPKNVDSPSHYEVVPGIEAKEIIMYVLDSLGDTITPYQSYCLGSLLKYRLRAGNKDDMQQDIAKADKFKEMYEDASC